MNITDEMVNSAAEAFSLSIHQIELVWEHMSEKDRGLYRDAARAALAAALAHQPMVQEDDHG